MRAGKNDTYEHVWIVGPMFEYTYEQSCAKDRNKTFCSRTSTTFPSSPADCSLSSSISFYTNAHDFAPGSQKQFVKRLPHDAEGLLDQAAPPWLLGSRS